MTSTTTAPPAVIVDNVSKKFRLYKERNQTLKSAVMRGRKTVAEDFWAVRDVSFEVPQGHTFGLIGRNGSGKSTLLKTLARIYHPDQGTITLNGTAASMLEVGSGFHPELTGRENIYLNGSILGLSRKQVKAKFDDIVEFSGVEKFLEQPVKNYSSGMYVRLGFSVAVHTEPDILVVDEVLAVGDGAFREKSRLKFLEFTGAGRTVIFVSHALNQVKEMCDQVAWLEKGRLREVGDATEVTDRYEKALEEEKE
ncbi:MAG: ABC transporter ATP-binding protein [Microcella sp.]|uniref:ABC transporter ATP-binding protein n=1 Tax=Microcella sp. TaxID=1913979 RepID=UPI003316085C